MAISRLCSIHECGKPSVVRGWCRMHYRRWRRNGEVQADIPPRTAPKQQSCSVLGCANRYEARGLCSVHYHRWQRTGDASPEVPERTPAGEALRFLEDVVMNYDGDDCLTWPYTRTSGYGQIDLEGKGRIVSRIVCEKINGAPPSPEYDAAHSCGKGHEGCVTKGHVSWKTRAENILDKNAHGTMARGSRSGQAKLTEDDIRTIRGLRGIRTYKQIAEMFGVSISNIGYILTGRTWGWLR